MKTIRFMAIVSAALFFCLALRAGETRYGDDGAVEVRDTTGGSTKLSMDGKTPYGEPIEEVREVVQKKDFVVEIFYSAAFSDDILDGNMKLFFREIVSSLQYRVNEKKPPKDRLRLVISNCRFGKTGYCKRTGKSGIALVTYRNGEKLKELTVKYEDILVKKQLGELALKTVDELLK